MFVNEFKSQFNTLLEEYLRSGELVDKNKSLDELIVDVYEVLQVFEDINDTIYDMRQSLIDAHNCLLNAKDAQSELENHLNEAIEHIQGQF